MDIGTVFIYAVVLFLLFLVLSSLFLSPRPSFPRRSVATTTGCLAVGLCLFIYLFIYFFKEYV